MANEKKFLDEIGVQYLWEQLSMEDYPNNETLMAVITAIDETKADKSYVDNKIPSVTVADAGKFLRVSEDGNWIVSSIARAEEGSF